MPGLKEQLHNRLFAIRWGGHSLISLYISILSGIVLGLQYNPAEPFYSVATIELAVPFGSFWRSLHYYSSQAFFILLLIHLALSIWQKKVSFSPSAWLRLSAAVPLALFLLFTGYILRGDATGEAAGAIAENILLSIRLLGRPLNQLLFDVHAVGVQKVYLNHVAGLMVLGGIAVWPHIRRYTALWRNHIPLSLLLLVTAVLLPTPMEPERFGLLHIAGPWFFLGLQELLRYLPIFWAGVFAPAIPVGILLFLPSQGKARTWCLLVLTIWLAGYLLLTGLSLPR